MSARPQAGAILWRTRDSSLHVALSAHDDVLPRAEVRAGEHPLSRARALAGHEAVVGALISRQRRNGLRLDYWEMQVAGDRHSSGVRWLPADDAVSRVREAADLLALRRFQAAERADSTILLVRHGRAGSRSRWRGDDDLRPLDGVGRTQASRLGETLPAWSPTRIISADKARCVQTIEPLANALGLPVEQEEAFDEERNQGNALPAVTRISELAAGATTVICSQGGVIPSAVAALHAAAGITVGNVRAKKGSTWALQFASGRLVHADYYADFEP